MAAVFVLPDPSSPVRAAELAEGLRDVTLKPGDSGEAVALLQRALVALSYLTEEQVQTGPGHFGPKTTQALKALQADWKVEPTGVLCEGTSALLHKALAGAPPPGGWTGVRAAPGTSDARHWIAVTAPTRNGAAARSAEAYDAVIDQFAVETNPRYAPRNGNTYGHIFLWDVTTAMGAEVPHWVDPSGAPSAAGSGRELLPADVSMWLETHGERRGWRWVDADEAQQLAAQGHPVVATALVTGGTRLGVVRPGPAHPRGPWVAVVGGRPQARVLAQEVLSSAVEFWANDAAVTTVTDTPLHADDAPRQRDLKRGDSGQDVLWAQETLVALGDLSRADMGTGPGAFGPRTELALKAFQLKAGVPPTGIVGILTRAAMNGWVRRAGEPAARSPGVVLEKGAAGREVWSLQNALLRIGLMDWDGFVTSPGIYGPRTEAAVRTLQLRFGHRPTGTYGPRTHELLEEALAGKLPAPAEGTQILGAERAIAFAMNPTPNEGPAQGRWQGCAMALVREAYRSSMRIKGPLSEDRPLDAYKTLEGQGRIERETNAPRGALTFFRFGKSGHVGISLGDGRYVGASTSGPPSEVRPIWTRTYLGWASP